LFNDSFESNKLHYSVRHLSAPERGKTFIQTIGSFILQDLIETSYEVGGELSFLRCLDSDLASFKGAQGTISNDFSTGTRNSPSDPLILDSVVISNDSLEDVLEHFIESELSHTLSGITQKSRGKAKSKSTDSFLSSQHLDALHHIRVHLRFTYLVSTLHNVYRGNTSMGQPTRHSTTNKALAIVRSIMNVSHLFVLFIVYNSLDIL
jgi:hypothetical protein